MKHNFFTIFLPVLLLKIYCKITIVFQIFRIFNFIKFFLGLNGIGHSNKLPWFYKDEFWFENLVIMLSKRGKILGTV